jgi:hypothetical protein
MSVDFNFGPLENVATPAVIMPRVAPALTNYEMQVTNMMRKLAGFVESGRPHVKRAELHKTAMDCGKAKNLLSQALMHDANIPPGQAGQIVEAIETAFVQAAIPSAQTGVREEASSYFFGGKAI